MNEGKQKRLNEAHPDCAEYSQRFKEIWDTYFEIEEMERAKYPDWRGFDHPTDEVVVSAYRECCKKTKELQKKYAYLFIGDDT